MLKLTAHKSTLQDLFFEYIDFYEGCFFKLTFLTEHFQKFPLLLESQQVSTPIIFKVKKLYVPL